MSRSSRLSADALATLEEIEQDARDGHTYTAAELAEYDAFCALHEANNYDDDRLDVADYFASEAWLAGATHDGAGYPLDDSFPF